VTVFRNDIYSGTQAQYSSDGNSDSMRVEAMVVLDKAKSRDGSDDGPALLRWATNEYFTQNPQRYYSPGHTALPLSRINARQIARNLVQLTIDYGGRQQIGSPRTVADFEAITLPVTVFASPDDGTDEPKYQRGLPMGVLLGTAKVPLFTSPAGGGDPTPTGEYTSTTDITNIPADQIDLLRTDTHERSAVRIRLRKVDYGRNPVDFYKSALRTTNDTQQEVAGLTCAPGTLLFEGISSNASSFAAIDPSGNVPGEQLVFDYTISLVYDESKFPVQRFTELLPGPEGQPYSVRDLIVTDQYLRSNWTI
jgi:hypothetical protein